MKTLKRSCVLAVAFSALLAVRAHAEPAYLYVFFHDDNTNGERFRTEFQDLQTCLKALESARAPDIKSSGGDYEVAIAMWCGGELGKHAEYTDGRVAWKKADAQ